MPATVLVFHAKRADRFAELLRPQLPPDARLLTAGDYAEAERVIPETDVLFSWRFPSDLFHKAERLRWVQAMGAGVEDLVEAPLPAGCVLTRVEGLFGGYMSEYAFGHMLAHAQQFRRLYADQAAGRWQPFEIGKLAGKRLGVAGAGSIGAEVARKGQAFGMEVWALVRSERPMPGVDKTIMPEDATAFTAGVDYLVSSLPDTPETRGLIDPMLMKEGALLINMGRGATIDETRLLEAVRSGRIQAVLDVFVTEPLPAGHPFWSTPGITVTPHISGPSVPSEVAQYFAENFARYQACEPLLGLVRRERGY